MSRVIVFDTETTDRENGEIIEAAWIDFPVVHDLAGPAPDVIPLPAEWTEARDYAERFRPDGSISYGAMAVHHLVPIDLVDCRASSEFALPADVAYIIGHSIDFDWQAAGSPAHVKRIDTHAISRHLWDDELGHSLVALTYRTRGATPETRRLVRDAHSALADCGLVLMLLEEILLLRPEIRTWSALWQFSEDCRIPLRCPIGKQRGTPLTELDEGFMRWCLARDFDAYFLEGLRRELRRREEAWRKAPVTSDTEDDDVPF